MYKEKEAPPSNADENVEQSSTTNNNARPPTGKKPSPTQGYLQKRRSKIAASRSESTTNDVGGGQISADTHDAEEYNGKVETENESKDGSPNLEHRRATRSKSIVNIMKIHASTNSIPAAVEAEDEDGRGGVGQLERAGSEQSLARGGQQSSGMESLLNDTRFLSAPERGQLNKSFTSDSVIFQEMTNRSESDGDYLAANHPLMKRYQQAVKDHFEQQKEQLRVDLKQSEDGVKKKQREYEKIGRDAFALNGELEKLRKMIAQKDEEFDAISKERTAYELQTAPLAEQIRTAKLKMDELEKAEKTTNAELRKLNTQLNELLSDVAITNHVTIAKNAVKKAQQDLVVVEQEKSRQENTTARLLETATRKEEELKSIEAEIKATTDDVAEKKDRLAGLTMETQSIAMEKRNLLQRWNATLKGMRRRDEELAEVQTALTNHQQNSTRVENELTALAKVYASVRESNDRLIGTLVRLQDEVDRCGLAIGDAQANSNSIDGEIAASQTALDELVVQRSAVQKEKIALTNALNGLTTKLRTEWNEIAKLEDSASEFSSDFQTKDLSMAEAVKQLEKTRRANRESEKTCSELESNVDKDTTAWLEVDSSVQALKKSCEEYKDMMEQTRISYERTRQELEKQSVQINKKQLQIDGLLKKLDIEKRSSNVDALLATKLSSIRQELDASQKGMLACDERVAKLQKDWMKLQDQLIRATETIERENATINAILGSQTELEQAKIRLQAEIEINEEEENQLRKRIDQMHVQIAKLNEAITKRHGARANLENDHLASYGHFSSMLKDAELECVQLEEKLSKKMKEKENVEANLNVAIHNHGFWESKIAAARSARENTTGGHYEEEQVRLVADVHRIQSRLSQLMKQQETTVKEMEKAVSKRNVLLQKGEAVGAAKTVQLTQAQLNRVVIDLRRKVKQFQRDLEAAEREEEDARIAAETVVAAVETKLGAETDVAQKRAQLMDDMAQMSAAHFKNSHLLAAQQLRHKRLEDAREARYEPLCKDVQSLETKKRAELEKRELMLQLVNNIAAAYPQAAESVKKIEALLNV